MTPLARDAFVVEPDGEQTLATVVAHTTPLGERQLYFGRQAHRKVESRNGS